MPATVKYGSLWPETYNDLQIEIAAIRRGGTWLDGKRKCGNGLFFHYKAMQKLLWPKIDHHRWAELVLKTIIESDVTVLMGPGDSSKTYSEAAYALTDWWCFPDETLFLCSSTELRGSELRIWGNIKDLYNEAIENWPDLPGRVLETMHAVTNDEIDDDGRKARSLRTGLIFIPCLKGGRWVGLGALVGMKAPRLRHIGDECQFMASGFLDAYSNWIGKENFKGIVSGNPLDPLDPLGIASEPMDGWNGFVDTEKTQTWKSRFFNASVVNLDGRDSPNFDYPPDGFTHFPYLVGPKKLAAVAATHGKDSWQYFNQCAGKMKPGMMLNRVITRELCRLHHANEPVRWAGTGTTKIYALDPAYGGVDRCVGGMVEFGDDLDGNSIIKVHPPRVIPIRLSPHTTPEDQIAEAVELDTREQAIDTESVFYDSFGRGTLGNAFARKFGQITPIPVDSGARPTRRPVRFDLFTVDLDGTRRLMRCDEQYSKFVTEMWYSVREVIEGDQLRDMPEEVMMEGCLREFYVVLGNKIEIEPKEDTRKRMGRSPDLFDWLSIAIEGCRQRGFKIRRLGSDKASEATEDYLEEEEARYRQIIKSKGMHHV